MKDMFRSRLLIQWIKLTVIIFAAFTGCALSALDAFAEPVSYGVFDMVGREAVRDKEGTIHATSDLEFKFYDLSEPEEEISENRVRRWIFCEKECVNGRDIYTPVHNGVYRLDVRGDTEISFLWVDRESGEVYKEKSLPDVCRIKYENNPDTEADAEFIYEGVEENEEVFIRDEAPVLRVRAPEYLNTFLETDNGKTTERYEIRGEKEFTFTEGDYSLSLWSEDGWGVIHKSTLTVSEFTYDCSKPLCRESAVKTPGKTYIRDGSLYSREAVIIVPDGDDSISGISHYIFRVKNGIDGAEYETYGDELQINPCFNGSVSVRAVDRTGNVSDEVYSPLIVIDNMKPFFRNSSLTESKKDRSKLKLKFESEDSISGLYENRIIINGSLKKSDSFKGEKKGITEYMLDTEKLKNGVNEVKLEVEDMLGNTVFYKYDLKMDDKKDRKKGEGAEKEETPGDPEMYIKGFRNFEKRENGVKIEAGSDSDYPEEGKVYIERHGKDGEIENVYEADPGYISIDDEGSYVVRYVIEHGGRRYEEYGYFTIDRSSPEIISLRDLDKKVFTGFSLEGDPLNQIRDYTYVSSRMTLSGREYDGREIKEPGKYVLKITATDELGHSAEERAEFVIINKDRENTLSDNSVCDTSLSKDKLSMNSVRRPGAEKKKESVSPDDIFFILSDNSPGKNLSAPGGQGEEKTVYNKRSGFIPIVSIFTLFVLIVLMLILIINPLLERSEM